MQRILTLGLLLAGCTATGQTLAGNWGRISGGVQLDGQTYFDDDAIGTQNVPEKFLYNGYANLNYSIKGFEAGARFEAYQNPLLGFSPDYTGQGVPFRYLGYRNDFLEVTAGTFYEQFGSGMVLRSYWEPLLGTDNAIDGFRVVGHIKKAIHLKAVLGKQRLYFGRAEGIVRGVDGEIELHNLFTDSLGMPKSDFWRLSVGGNFVSKYEEDTDPELNLPENVAAMSGRINLGLGKFNLFGEYAYKVNDPAPYNRIEDQFTTFNPGSGLLLTASYATKGLGATVSFKRLENMDFRSDRSAEFTFNEAPINFLPPLAAQHTWRLQTLYLYATSPNSEIGLQADLAYKFAKGTKLGGQYGLEVAVNYSEIHNLDRDTTGLAENLEYAGSEFFAFGDELLYRDVNVDITKKFSKKIKLQLAYIWSTTNLEITRIGTGTATVHTAVVDVLYKPQRKHGLHFQAQHLFTGEAEGPDGNEGSWAQLLVEYSYAPHWFVAAWNEYNYGNFNADRRLHYPGFQTGYTFGGNRLTVGYARQRAGIICVGGVCRALPASNGFTFSLSSTF